MGKKNWQKAHAADLGYAPDLQVPVLVDRNALARLDPEGADAQAIHEVMMQKLALLRDHYELNATDTVGDLLFRVLKDWVPGFSVQHDVSRAGRSVVNDTESDVLLAENIDLIRRTVPRLNLKRACQRFLNNNRDDPRWRDTKLKTVTNRYAQGKKVLDARLAAFNSSLASDSAFARRLIEGGILSMTSRAPGKSD